MSGWDDGAWDEGPWDGAEPVWDGIIHPAQVTVVDIDDDE